MSAMIRVNDGADDWHDNSSPSPDPCGMPPAGFLWKTNGEAKTMTDPTGDRPGVNARPLSMQPETADHPANTLPDQIQGIRPALTEANRTLHGGPGNDVFHGDADDGHDTVYGYGGDDTLFYHGGTGIFYGGSGYDRLTFEEHGAINKFSFVGTYRPPEAVIFDLADNSVTVRSSGRLLLEIHDIERIRGTSHDDIYIGDDRSNWFAGYGGNDWFDGGPGRDGFYGGEGIDTLSYAWLDDDLTANLETGKVEIGGSHPYVERIRSIENIVAGSGDDTLIGNARDNLFIGGAGSDSFYGGEGSDTVDYSDAPAGITSRIWSGSGYIHFANGDRETVDSIENLIGSGYDDMLLGNNAPNMLVGGGGSDHINGFAGNDVISPGAGGGNTLHGGEGYDVLSYADSSVSLAISFETRTTRHLGSSLADDRIYGFEHVAGGRGNDIITGSAHNNLFYASEGDDRVSGRSGNDTYILSAIGDDMFFGEAGLDTLLLPDLAQRTPTPGPEPDRSWASRISYDVNLTTGAVSFDGNTGTLKTRSVERIVAGNGDDIITGTADGETIYGGRGANIIDGGAGDDFIRGGDRTEDYRTFRWSSGTIDGETLHGGAGDDVIHGEGNSMTYSEWVSGHGSSVRRFGRENLYGDDGDDTLRASWADSYLNGGAGADRFEIADTTETVRSYSGAVSEYHVYRAKSATVEDFTPSEDKLVFFIENRNFDRSRLEWIGREDPDDLYEYGFNELEDGTVEVRMLTARSWSRYEGDVSYSNVYTKFILDDFTGTVTANDIDFLFV